MEKVTLASFLSLLSFFEVGEYHCDQGINFNQELPSYTVVVVVVLFFN